MEESIEKSNFRWQVTKPRLNRRSLSRLDVPQFQSLRRSLSVPNTSQPRLQLRLVSAYNQYLTINYCLISSTWPPPHDPILQKKARSQKWTRKTPRSSAPIANTPTATNSISYLFDVNHALAHTASTTDPKQGINVQERENGQQGGGRQMRRINHLARGR
jgi:hypothetical protein